jgi:hypothetical protein
MPPCHSRPLIAADQRANARKRLASRRKLANHRARTLLCMDGLQSGRIFKSI